MQTSFGDRYTTYLAPGDGRCWFPGYNNKILPYVPPISHRLCTLLAQMKPCTVPRVVPLFVVFPHLLQVMHSGCPEKSMQFTMYGSTHLPMLLPTLYIVSYHVAYLVSCPMPYPVSYPVSYLVSYLMLYLVSYLVSYRVLGRWGGYSGLPKIKKISPPPNASHCVCVCVWGGGG